MMLLNSTDFNQIFNIAPSWHLQTIQNVIKDTSPSQEHQNHHQLKQELQKCHQSLREFLMPSNSSDFNKILNIVPSGHVETIQNVIKDTSTNQEHQNHHQLQPKIYKCHQSLRGFLIPLNSWDFNQILNIAPSGHVQAIHNVIKDANPSQKHQDHHQLQQELKKCHQSLREILMPSNLLDFNKILNITP